MTSKHTSPGDSSAVFAHYPAIPVPVPILFIAGDVHHDGSDPGFARWLDRLALRPAARLVLLGDVVEWWIDGGSCISRHAPVLDRLRALRNSGWRVDIVRGNRELAAGRVFEIASGCRLSWPRLDVQLGPTRVRVVHGDRLIHDPRYHAWSALCRSFPFRVWQRLHPAIAQEAVAMLLRRTSRGNRPASAMRHIRLDPRRVRAAARGADVLVAGHIHESWRRCVGGVDLILAGHWPPGRGHWLEGFADGHLERHSDAV